MSLRHRPSVVRRFGGGRLRRSLESEVRAVLFCCDGAEYQYCGGDIISLERQVDTGGIYSGVLPQQRGNPWNRIYPEYLRDVGDGSAYDYRERPAV